MCFRVSTLIFRLSPQAISHPPSTIFFIGTSYFSSGSRNNNLSEGIHISPTHISFARSISYGYATLIAFIIHHLTFWSLGFINPNKLFNPSLSFM